MKFRFFLLMLLPICMVGCNDEMDSLVKGPSEVAESITQMTRSISPDSIYDGELVEFEPTQDMIRLKELYAEMHSTQRRAPLNPSSTYDETLWGNMYAIRELPATIKVRSKASTGSTANYVSLYCEGKSKEVTLNAGNAGDKNRFLIKVLPASAGVPYLIYSVAAGTPLSVGYYTNKPDEKILMASKDDSGCLNKDINASFSWKSNSASGNLSFGKNDGSSTTQEYETQNTKVYIKTFGGSPLYQAAVGPRDLNTLSVDLSAWLNSLNDKSTNTLIDITSGLKEEECGLYPMSDFVLEKNFRYRMDDTTLGLLESLTDVVDPRFEIVKVLARISSTGEKLYEVAAVLNTRQGDKIVLSDGTYKNAPDSELRANNSNQTMMNRVQEIFAQKKTVFQGLEFSTNYSTTYNPDVRKPLCIRLDGFDENKMAFYADPKSNMRYIYDSSKKIAFAYNEDEEYGDYVLDYYGIRDWVESLPKRSTSMMILQNYTIIGL